MESSPKPIGAVIKTLVFTLVVPTTVADESAGKFWVRFGPPSVSPASFGVEPAGCRSMPRPPFVSIEFEVNVLPVPAGPHSMPAPLLKLMRFE